MKNDLKAMYQERLKQNLSKMEKWKDGGSEKSDKTRYQRLRQMSN
jgi:hypothetical protein